MKYGFIGCGNMGGALAAAAAKAVGGSNLYLADPFAEKVQALAESLGAKVSSNEEIAQECDYIILGVKPQVMSGVVAALPISGAPIMVSMAAGLSLEQLQAMRQESLSWIRMMPNTPVAVGEGRILYSAAAAPQEVEGFLKLFSQAGKLFDLDEKLMDAGSALSGCGPAFVYQFIEALADGGVACGLPRGLAVELAAGTLLGASKTLLESGAHPAALKDAVCSPGGSTIMGVKALENGGLRGTTMNAVIEAYNKTKELGGKKNG